jgi:7-cyano-7-deazaguanine reductase
MSKLPLGEPSSYPDRYAPELLYPVARLENRQALGLAGELPFSGEDIWNAWELTWLEPTGKPVVATAVITVPAESANIIESKSLKLYLNSFAMERYDSVKELTDIISKDLSRVAGSPVAVNVISAGTSTIDHIENLPGHCIDYMDVSVDAATVDASLLKISGDQSDNENLISEELHSHLLRSNCPVTNQPDMGSVLVRYSGPRIEQDSLLRYIASFRQHNDFHEACVERMFTDIKAQCRPDKLTVYARFNRRGGLDINPFRSDFETTADNTRLWRQ